MISRFRNQLAYVVGGVANSFALFLLIPYLVLRLSPTEYGIWSLFEVMTLFITMVTVGGQDVGLMRVYWGENAAPPRPLIGTVLIGALGISILISIMGILLISYPPLFTWLTQTFPIEFTSYMLMLVLFIGVMEGMFNLILGVLRVREQAVAYVTFSFGRMLLFLILVVFWVENGGGLEGALTGRLSAAVVGLVVGFLMILPHFDWVWHRPMWLRVIRYGLPLLPTHIATYILLASDRYILTAFTSGATVAAYSFMYKLATTLDIVVIRPFALEWAQRRFTIAASSTAHQGFNRVLLLFLWVSLTFALLIFAGTRFIYTWLDNPAYTAGMEYVPVILLGFVAYGLSYPLNLGMILKDRTQWLPPLSWLSALVCLALNFWWIPLFGMAGAAWATLVAYSLFSIAYAIGSQYLYPIRYPWEDIAKIVVCALVAGAGIYGVDGWLPTAAMLGTAIKVLWVLLWMGSIGYLLFGAMLQIRQPTVTMEQVEG
jgi:O-antigen/teichoic acid export membrane protein